MKEKVNMGKIAEMFNVSIVTVSKALNDKDGVSDELREKIKKTAEDLGYRPNHAAKSLKTQKVYNVGILIANRYVDSQEAYYFSVCGELIKKLTALEYSGIMEILQPDDERDNKMPRMFLESKVDGIIVLGQLEEAYLRHLETIDIPMIYFDFYVNYSNIDSIISDNFFSSYQITDSLIEKGHKQIGFVGNIHSTSSIQDRYLGYYKALLEHQMDIDNEYIVSDRDGLGKLIDLKLPRKMPTAFVANCDQVAYKLINTLKKEGYEVPKDVSVVSFDNTIYSTIAQPQITTVDNNVEDMVTTATRIMIKKINNPIRTYGRVLIKGKVIKRESSQNI
ncbi:LacI family DNA-binding transcriptional regulator [Peloplasma aerotolerans]|jgi:LacI family transcriptional regulator|uniref:LacI family DNA-binding transcriptional regulator n=1 Tax=Peloplasma aerotolerans TaxID=3044389 RepID=A0AAW6U9J8_9MOLU|nr:LacI family DNA-binding transcriptional regulator [Mariniplasma sp. M4Ah]MDI6452756.1 LacI family DNA-binding transcriptional regulator [Mariniplasma sp. M4Ah]MDR4967981.1 LacI family DNA-binding transcriptional regulator [Acholeplasmataceae bacterium]